MAIALAQNYTSNLDEVYKNSSVTSVLDDNKTVTFLSASRTFLAPKISMTGMGDYDRNSGYVNGTVNLSYGSYEPNYDRGVKFSVDYLDNKETANVAFGKLASEFTRTLSAPELDAFRISSYAGVTGISSASETITTGEQVLAALVTCKTQMDEDQVPAENRYLFITPSKLNVAKAVDLTKNTGILDEFIIKVTPQSRMYTAIDLLDGTSSGETAGGYKKSTSATDINFLAIHKSSVIQASIRNASDIIEPSDNADADAYIQKFRSYGIAEVYDNKLAGIYLSSVPASTGN